MPPEAAKPHSVSELIHPVFGLRLGDPCHGLSRAWLAMGCFWGAERLFWRLPGVRLTAVGYLGGWTDAPSYEAVCTGNTGHAETVMVVFDERSLPYEALLAAFFEGHDPTQGWRQGNDVGSQYRSLIACADETQYRLAVQCRDAYGQALTAAGFGPITTEILFPAPPFHFAEAYHQQYLFHRPTGYCGLQGTGVRCPVGRAHAPEQP
ncbi:MAG: peptide methionine sulfoxide reductase MsrA [Lysobacterales bacterium]|jgi:peptide-methionine (S)-S-oxide reductase|nr:MAG: peptide methionine sulfoxide reductase MsrA [Xanthomonadales bacterium]